MLLFDRRSLVLAGLALTGCGFTPVYQSGTKAADLHGTIAIETVEGRYNFELRQSLIDQLGDAGSGARYRLSFSQVVTASGLALTETEGTTRNNLTGVATFTIREQATGRAVYSGDVTNFTAYSSTSATYPTRIAEQDARIRLARSLAEQMAAEIAITAKGWHS